MAVKKQKITIGRRKEAVCRVMLSPGTGKIVVNGKDYKAYFMRASLVAMIQKPFEFTNRVDKYDIIARIAGGGLAGQAGALRFAISRAINDVSPDSRGTLKRAGYLTRDSREVQRKMYGHKKARKSFQFSKR